MQLTNVRLFGIFVTLTSLSLALTTLHAQPDYLGQVVSNGTSQPVEDAIVQLDRQPADNEAEYEARSNLFGFFRINDVELGNYKLTVRHPSYLEHTENLVIQEDQAEKPNKTIRLNQANVTPVFDVDFEVYDLATMVPLEGAHIEAEYWRPDGTISGGADNVFRATADQLGKGSVKFLENGFYRFTMRKPGWEDIVYKPDPSLGPIAGDKLRLIRDHMAGVYMKPIRTGMEVEVRGYDAVSETENFPMRDAVLQMTGYDFQFDSIVLPQTTMLTDTAGQNTYTNLVAIPYKLSVAKLGYEPKEFDVRPQPGGGFANIETELDLLPTKVEVILDSPYENTDILEGARVLLRGVDGSSAEGITREAMTALDEDGVFVKVLFENLMPGRYWLQTTHEATMENLPTQSGPIQGPGAFNIKFYPVETYAEVEPGMTETVFMDLEPIPATIQGRLWATDTNGNLEFEPCFSEPNRVFYQTGHNGIEFIEHELIQQLDDEYQILSVDTDEAGNYTATIIPGIYGLKIPTMTGYAGHNVEFGDLSEGIPPSESGWPYPETWPYDTFEFGHQKAGLRFDSTHLYQLDLFVHRHYIHAGGRVKTTGEPFGAQVLRMNEDGSGLQTFPYNHLLATDAKIRVTGPVTMETTIRPDNFFLMKNLLPGTYVMELLQEEYNTPPVTFTIEGWDAPGILPRVAPFTPTYFFPGISHCTGQFDIEADWKLKGEILIETSRYNANSDRYNETGPRRPQYFMSSTTGNKVFTSAFGDGIPNGDYIVWIEHGDGWFFGAGSGSATIERSIDGGPLDNTKLNKSPIYRGLYSGSTTVGSLTNYHLDVHAVSTGDPNREIPNVTVLFSGDPTPKLPAGTTSNFTGSPYPSGAIQEPGQWTYAFWPPGKVEVIDPEARLLKLTVFMQRAMLITGTLKGGDNEAIPGAAIVARNRYGNPVSNAVTDSSGRFSVARLVPQTIYLDINRRGYKPIRVKYTPTNFDEPDFLNQNLTMEKVPGPDITKFTLNRFGMFIPGVTKAGDSNLGTLGLNPEASRGKLTATWKVAADPKSYQLNLPGFVGENEQPRQNEQSTVRDKIEEVWIVDKRYFKNPSVNDEQVWDLAKPSPLNYIKARDWFAEITSGQKDNEPFYVVHKIGLKGDINDDGEFEGKLPLWELPAGELKLMAVVISKNGGVSIKDYELPDVTVDGETKKPAPLRGMTLPRWAANILEVVGTASNLPSFNDPPDDDDEDGEPQPTNRRQGSEDLNKNFGDRFLKLANSAKIEARIGVVPTYSSTNNVNRTVFNPTEDLLSNDHYLTYKYVLGAELPIGEDSPQRGPMSLASKFMGLKVSGAGVDAEFEVAGGDNQACIALVLSNELEANKDAAKDKFIPKLVERAKARAGDTIKFDGPKLSISAKFANCQTFESGAAGVNRLSMSTGILEAQGTVDLGVGIDITPVIEFLPYGKPIQELNEAIKDLLDYEALKLEAIFELTTGAKVTVKFEHSIPRGRDRSQTSGRNDPSRSTPGYNLIGTVSDVTSDITNNTNISNEKKLIVRVAVGLRGSLANNALSATGKVQFGAPKGQSDVDGVFFDINDFGAQPLVKKIAGAISFVLEAKLNLYVTSISKKWQYDLLTFSIERASVPVFELTPLNTSSIIITPMTALPAQFVGKGGTLVNDFYDAGHMDFSSGDGTSLVYTGTDPETGEMTIMMSQMTNGEWQTPRELARSTGMVSVASEQLADGSWLVVWSELAETDILTPYPSTVLKSVQSDPSGQQWSAPVELMTSEDAIYQLNLTSLGSGAMAAFYITDEGPLGRNRSLHTMSWSDGTWMGSDLALADGEWVHYELNTVDEIIAKLSVSNPANELYTLDWNGATWSSPSLALSNIRSPFDVHQGHQGNLIAAGIMEDQTITLHQWDADSGQFTPMPSTTLFTPGNDINVLPLQIDGINTYLLAWIEGADEAAVLTAWVNENGELISGPTPITHEASGEFRSIQLQPHASGIGHLVATYANDESQSIREYMVSIPSGDDCDGDGINDILAITEGLVADCNGNGIPDRCDIQSGFSNDLNGDMKPDECDPFGSGDCNMNGILDADEIALGFVDDLDGNGIPDECDGPVVGPSIRTLSIVATEAARFYRGRNLIILGEDPTTILIQVEGPLETAPTVNGPWTIAP